MNKNTIIGTLLISVLLMYVFRNNAIQSERKAEEIAKTEQEAKIKKQETLIEEKIKVNEETTIISNDSTAIANRNAQAESKFGAFYLNATGQNKSVSIENDLLKITFNNKGSQITKVELKEFGTWKETKVNLVDNSQNFDFSFKTKDNKVIETKKLFYEINKINDKTVSLKLKVSENQYLEHKYSLEDGSYFLDFDMNFVNLENSLNSSNKELSASWNLVVHQQEKELVQEKRKSSIYWKIKGEDEVEKLSPGSSKEEELEGTDWIAFKDQFFNVTFLTEGEIIKAKVISTIDNKDTTNVSNLYSQINLEDKNSYNFQYYYGPNDYKLLQSFENSQELIVELSSNFFLFSWVKHITKWIVLPLFHFLEKFNLSYGIIIILLTLIIRMAMMPLTFKSYVSTAKTKLLKPQLDALKEKYKDDQQKFASEQMKLYQSTGVSMFGGCLPMLLQMPFFLAMFYFFPSSIELRGQSFLWATDLSSYDVLFQLPFTIPMYGSHISGFTLLMTISSLVMARFNPQMQNQNVQPGMEMMKYMPYIFPVFLMVMFNSWAAGLTLYYSVSNIVTLSQQLFINKFLIDDEKLLAQIEENKKKKPKKSGFRAKMSEAYNKQLEIEKEKQKK